MLLFVHVAISLIGIATGFVVIWGFLNSKPLNAWTATFLATTVGTSVTGFLFPITKLTPGIIFGLISLPLLGVAIYALYAKHLAGIWRPVYIVTAILAQYLNFFVLIVQSFLKVGFLHDLAPTQAEPPFAVAQGVALIAFLALGFLSLRRYRPILAPAG